MSRTAKRPQLVGRAVPLQSPRRGHTARQASKEQTPQKGLFKPMLPGRNASAVRGYCGQELAVIPASPETFPTPGLWKGAGFHQWCLYPQHTPHTLGTLVSGSPGRHLCTGWAGTQGVIRAGRALVLLHTTGPIRQPITCPNPTSCQPRSPPILHVLTKPKLPLCGFGGGKGRPRAKLKTPAISSALY